MRRNLWMVAMLAILPMAAQAAPDGASTGPRQDVLQGGFLDYHPDMANNNRGMEALRAGDAPKAMEYFRRAARYADKASQALLGEMYWYGVNMPPDRVKALQWMELAAERDYPTFVELRDKFRAALTPEELQQVEAGRKALWDEYGDAVASPRIAKELERGRRAITGSRTGALTGQVEIQFPAAMGGMRTIQASEYYKSQFWDPVEYQQWVDKSWIDYGKSKVRVGEVEAAAKAGDTK